MKKKILKVFIIFCLASLLIISCIGCGGKDTTGKTDKNDKIIVDIDKEHFPEPLLLEKAEKADKNSDGKLSEKEIGAVIKINLKKLLDEKGDSEDGPYPVYTASDFSINLEGIQYFTALKEITIDMQGGELFVDGKPDEILAACKNFEKIYECRNLVKISLYEIDATTFDISKFENLKRLQLNKMYKMESFSPADASELKALWICGCDNLTVLDVSKLNNLKTLDIVDNINMSSVVFSEKNSIINTLQLTDLKKLETVDLSNLTGIESLNIKNVSLKVLDVSKNVNLVDFSAEGLSLNTLDLTNNKNVDYIINAGDSIKTIKLAKDNCVSMIRWTESEITEFPALDLNPETLTGIDIQGTKIKELDISKYPNLETLYYDEDVTEIIK